MNTWLIALAYLFGTIPFALLVSRRAGGADVRYAGSGNVGTANVLRTAGVPTAVFVLVLDMSKGAAAVLLAQRLGAGSVLLSVAAAAVVTGHVFPVWLKFRGGKGVATACGAFLVLAPTATVLAVGVFTVVVWATRYVSVGSVSASVLLPPLVYANDGPPTVVAAVSGVALLILYRHRSNLQRLSTGHEGRLGQRP